MKSDKLFKSKANIFLSKSQDTLPEIKNSQKRKVKNKKFLLSKNNEIEVDYPHLFDKYMKFQNKRSKFVAYYS